MIATRLSRSSDFTTVEGQQKNEFNTLEQEADLQSLATTKPLERNQKLPQLLSHTAIAAKTEH
jgi:hypothetical protein